ncbi:uncharacterized protein [Halyomorpha halys]|uniref:uncharacterized protein n=1 Tax=Halyomorpha halys TaxID=286706 RepID=UPI0006D4DC1C|nr:uncharacterized protein LOC106691434 [Halyomorpha halys]
MVQISGYADGIDICGGSIDAKEEVFFATDDASRKLRLVTCDRGVDLSVSGEKYEAVSVDNGYNKYMMLKIRSVTTSDFGSYQCVAKNSLGETDGLIKLDELPAPSTTTTLAPSTTEASKKKKGKNRGKHWKPRLAENQILEEEDSFDVEEWRGTDGEDYTLPTLGAPGEAAERGGANMRAGTAPLLCVLSASLAFR